MAQQVAQNSVAHFDSGFYCAESVLLAITEYYDIKSSVIPAIATGFCSGTSRTSGLCGAVAGGIMAISIFSGRRDATDSVEDNYSNVREFIQTFEKQHGTINCAELTGCRLDTKEGQKKFKDEQIITECKQFTAEATRIAMAIIEKI